MCYCFELAWFDCLNALDWTVTSLTLLPWMLFDFIIVIDVAPDYKSILPETPLPALPDALLLFMLFVYFLLNEFG